MPAERHHSARNDKWPRIASGHLSSTVGGSALTRSLPPRQIRFRQRKVLRITRNLDTPPSIVIADISITSAPGIGRGNASQAGVAHWPLFYTMSTALTPQRGATIVLSPPRIDFNAPNRLASCVPIQEGEIGHLPANRVWRPRRGLSGDSTISAITRAADC